MNGAFICFAYSFYQSIGENHGWLLILTTLARRISGSFAKRSESKDLKFLLQLFE